MRLYIIQPLKSVKVSKGWSYLLLRLSGTNFASSVISASVSTLSPSKTMSHSCLDSNHSLTDSMKELPFSLSLVPAFGDSRATAFWKIASYA